MTSPRQALEARYLYAQALLAGWEEIDNYWSYPVISPDGLILAYRLKRYPFSGAKAKYLWQGGKPESADAQWYILKDTQTAIKDAGGVAYMSNGEPAMLAYRAAGILNVLATTLSEIAVPKDAINYLRRMGIIRLIYIVDKDEAGLKSAVNWRDALSGSGIDFEALEWPAWAEKKADANDILIHFEGDSESFKIALEECQTLTLPESTAKPKTLHIPTQADYQDAHAKLAHAVLETLSNKGYLTGKRFRSGFYQSRCLHHDDSQASAGLDSVSGVMNCFVCGSHGLKENAAALGIKWEDYYPKKEGKKKPVKAEIQAFQQALEAIAHEQQKDKRSYEDVLRDEIMGRLMAYEAGQYVGIGQWKALPLAVISAVLNLCNGKSNVAAFILRLSDALSTGKLPSVCTRDEIARVLELPYRTVFNSSFEAEHLGFCTILRGINTIYTIAPKVSDNNPKGGRPDDLILIELDKEEILNRLAKMLEIYYLEKHSKKAIALPSAQMARQFGIEESTMKQWQQLAKEALNDPANKEAKRAYDVEMFGNGKNWKGWYKALESKTTPAISIAACKTSHDLRAELLKWWVGHIRNVNSREELCRLLGCTDPVIDKVMESANLTSDKQTQKVDIPKLPSTVQAMGYEYNRIQRDLQGHSWRGGFWHIQDKAWIPFDSYTSCIDTYARFAGQISKAYMLVQTPSQQRPMTTEELEKREEERAQEAAEKAQNEPIPAPVATDASDTPKAPKTERQRNVYLKWDKHSYAFLYRQLQLLVHCFTPCKLEQHIIFDKAGKPITSGQLPALMQWFSENASAKQTRKVKSFYGKNYDEDIDMAALQALADERKAMLGISESMEWEDEADSPVILQQMALEAAPAVIPTPVKRVAYVPCDDTTLYTSNAMQYPKPSPAMSLEYVMGLGRSREKQVNRFAKG